MIGNAGNNVLDGGTRGNDTLKGQAGNDTYRLTANNEDSDLIVERAGAGIDTVKSDKSQALGANLENLTLLDDKYQGLDIDGTGNALANTLRGNVHNNVLDGKAGDDVVIGGKGRDIFIVDSTADRVSDSEAFDTVMSSVSRSLEVGNRTAGW